MENKELLVGTQSYGKPLLNGWLRAILMLISWIIVSFLFQLLLAGLAMFDCLADYLQGSAMGFLSAFFALAGTLLITMVFMRYFDKLPFKALGFWRKGYHKEIVRGLIMGATLIGIGTLCLLLLHQIEFVKADFQLTYFMSVPFSLIMVAFTEEIVCRGYILRNLMQLCNKYIALAISSFLFSLLHLLNIIEGGFSWLHLLQIFLAGILIGLSYIYTKNLWFPIAFHFSWNLVQGYVFGFNVSGNEYYSLIGQQRFEDNLLNGGSFGFEGSILCTILILVTIVSFFLCFRKKTRLLLFCAICLAQTNFAQKQEIVPYIDFLKNQHTNPVDYVFQLFEKQDIVILGERDHRDTTQYDLIKAIMSDPRFIEKVGNVFTEVGVTNRTGWANKVLKGKYASDADFNTALRRLYRDLDYEVLWEKYNFWMFLSSIYQINKDLPENKKVTVHFTDAAYDWAQCTSVERRKKEYNAIQNNIRDSVMGNNFIRMYNQLLADKNNKRKKALVILNAPHSFQNYVNREGLLNSAASYIFKEYPDNVANVMINKRKIFGNGVIINGKWDAAFRYLGNPSVGFDMLLSPMGQDEFDDHLSPISPTVYKDIFTGFIFYKPIEKMVGVIGIPNIVDEEFMPEFERRRLLNNSTGSLDNDIRYYNTVRVVNTYDKAAPKDSIEAHINYWLMKE
ncbi:hypothetical protein AGMMS49525_02300 [Bacteroidia bacterium]|nr:hypothetical protein AGMMS49525_02300 [Bacteroidia bacterium]